MYKVSGFSSCFCFCVHLCLRSVVAALDTAMMLQWCSKTLNGLLGEMEHFCCLKQCNSAFAEVYVNHMEPAMNAMQMHGVDGNSES